jgi:hypothetical protein
VFEVPSAPIGGGLNVPSRLFVTWLLAVSLSGLLVYSGSSANGGQPAGAAAKDAAVEKDAVPAKAAENQPAEDAETPPAKPQATSFATALKGRGGQRTLLIEYLWKAHRNGSVEVRMAADASAAASLSPFYFVGDYLKGPVTVKVDRCLDRADDLGGAESFTKDKMDFKIIGQKNSLGKPSVMVIPSPVGMNPAKRPAAVFLALESWAVNDRMLTLDLPRDLFAKPGTLQVWFLRGEKVLWEERVAWPGY